MTDVEIFQFDRTVLRHYHLIALGLALLNLLEWVGVLAFTVDGLAVLNLIGALTMGIAWPLHEMISSARQQRAESRQAIEVD